MKHLVLNVKRATGNLKDAVAEAEVKAQKGKNSSKSVKPGAYLACTMFPYFSEDRLSCIVTFLPMPFPELPGITILVPPAPETDLPLH